MPKPEQRTEPGDAAAGLNPADGDAAGRPRAGTAGPSIERLLSDVQRIAHIGGWSWEPTGSIQWTDEMYRIYGVEPETFTPTVESLLKLVHPEDRPALQRWIGAHAERERSAELEYRAIRPDGSVRLLKSRVELSHDAGTESGRLVGTVRDVTERSAADEARARLAAIVENSSDAITGRAIDGTITSWNAAAERILGYTAAEAIGRKLIEIQPPELRQLAAERRKLILAGRPVRNAETVRIAKDGRRLDVTLSVSPLRDGSGNIIGTATIMRDITARKRVERELQHKTELAQLLEQLARAANEAVSPEAAMEICLARICKHGQWALGRVATFKNAGPFKADHTQWFCAEPERFDAFMRYTDCHEVKFDVGRFVGTVLRERRAVWLSDLAMVEKPLFWRLDKGVEAGLKSAFAFPVIVRGEVAAVLEFLATETRQPDALLLKGTSGLASQFARLIERRQRELELLQSEQRFHTLVEATNEIVWRADAQGEPIGENLSWRQFTGQTSEEITGGRWLEAVHPEDRAVVSGVVARGMAERKPYAVENRLRRADGAWRHFAVRAVPVFDADGTVREWIGACQDITESKAAGIALQGSHEQLRVLVARLNTAREDEAALLSREIHDELGQAVTGLKLDLLWLASRLGGDQRSLQEKINAMSSNADAAIAAIRNIASRLRPKMLDDLGLVAAIEAQARDFREHAGVKCEVVADLRGIELDPERSLAVFRIAQAAQTNIARHAAATRADISLHEQSGDLILEVRDNGRGIRDDEIEASSSIGLLGMRERALAVGARFTIVGFPGRGTVVTLRMPMT